MTDDTGAQASAELGDKGLQRLTAELRALLDVRDRSYGLPARDYPQCFVGSEAVSAMVLAGIASDAADAVRLGNLLVEAGVLRHVLDEHPFRDAYLFYRFSDDAGHGRPLRHEDGQPVSWADFLAPPRRGEVDTSGLQARIPERDPELSSFLADELDHIGIAPMDAHNVRLLDNVRPPAWIDPDPRSRYNLVVVGGGAGGLICAAAAAGLGARVALVESHLLGGDCLNVGCVPSKALIHCAKVAAAVRDAAQLGIGSGDASVDFGRVMARMRRLRAQISSNDSARRYAEDLGVDVFLGRGVFIDGSRIEVNGKTLEFAKAVVATGATAAVPPIPGLSTTPYLTNATLFNLTELPRRMAVIGAGPIGIELAQALQRLGSEVTVFSRGRILPREEPDAVEVVRQALEADGVRFVRVSEYLQAEAPAASPPIRLTVLAEGQRRQLEFDALLVAAGRKPSVAGLGLEDAGVDFDAREGVRVNERLQTSNPNIFALGDVASRYQFTHMADFMARLVVRNALFLGRDKHSDLIVPWATYTDPEIAHVGLYESDLTERDIAYRSFVRSFGEVDRALLEDASAGFVRIHVRQGSDRILGATIVAPHAGDMIGEIAVAMQAGMGLGGLAGVIHPYPTLAEAIRQCGDAYNRSRLTPTVRAMFSRLMRLQR